MRNRVTGENRLLIPATSALNVPVPSRPGKGHSRLDPLAINLSQFLPKTRPVPLKRAAANHISERLILSHYPKAQMGNLTLAH